MLIKPGDKVLITQNAFDGCPDGTPNNDDYYLVATKGSMGVVVSCEEYIDFILHINIPSLKEYICKMLPLIQKAFAEGEEYPIKFEKVAPIENEIKKALGNQDTFLGVGRIQLLPPDFFEVISEDEYA